MKKQTKDTTPQPEQTAPQSAGRVYNSQIVFDSDLFELHETKMQVQVPMTQPPEYKSVNHMHWFRTYDSDGRKMLRCHAVGGHFHEMKVIPGAAGQPPTVECGPPVKEVINKHKKKVVVPWNPGSDEPGADDPGDDQTHEVVYIRSQKLNMRSANAEAAKVMTQDAHKAAPIPGIQG